MVPKPIPSELPKIQASALNLQSSRSLLTGKVCRGGSSICRFGIGDDGSILRSQESQPQAHFFLVVFDDGLKQCDQVVLSLSEFCSARISAQSLRISSMSYPAM